MEVWQLILGGSGLVGGLGVLGGVFASRRRNTDLARRERDQGLGERWDDSIDLAEKIRVEVERQVEAQMKPIRAKMAKMEEDSQAMNAAVRTNVTQQWMWDQSGRPGPMPMLPRPVLETLGFGHLVSMPTIQNQED